MIIETSSNSFFSNRLFERISVCPCLVVHYGKCALFSLFNFLCLIKYQAKILIARKIRVFHRTLMEREREFFFLFHIVSQSISWSLLLDNGKGSITIDSEWHFVSINHSKRYLSERKSRTELIPTSARLGIRLL